MNYINMDKFILKMLEKVCRLIHSPRNMMSYNGVINGKATLVFSKSIHSRYVDPNFGGFLTSV